MSASPPSASGPSPLSYKDAGVDIAAGDALVERIKPLAKKTLRDGVLAGIGGFGALFELPKRYREPVLVSGTDGVGTKLKLAFEWAMHDTVGIEGIWPRDVLKKVSRGLSRVEAGNPGFPRLVQVTSGGFSWWL